MNQGINAGIVGGTGYAGGELCRLLLNHPGVDSILPTARGREEFERVHPNLLGSGLRFISVEELQRRQDELDVVFFCTPSGEAMKGARQFVEAGARVVDVSADFRFRDPEVYRAVYGRDHADPELLQEAAYGITELHRDEVRTARLVANPGCYVITATLGLAPLFRAGYAHAAAPVHISAVNGTTGAGTTPKREILHAKVLNSMLPYSLEGHRHSPELEERLSSLAGHDVTVDFSTAHGNFARGIYAHCSVMVPEELRDKVDRDALLSLYTDYYGSGRAGEPFVVVNEFPKTGQLNEKQYDIYPSLAGVMGSNFCHIGLDYDARRGIIKVIAVTDNIVKGAAGSAIQNMNVMLGLPEHMALSHFGL
ncbi:N-acetyl-gamma-glutamyl-phosphate reductase [Streptomyces alboflavus]|uniref:N-acetyl-gamma-glutamyl-phosphate reductase n=1 Tax=Streptomyces alboflavus TaxID=67267 RepID=UPI000F6586A9|nr:N-acetyl-gamma-glutamyl-phosphate reductase [Streptomyces alboflavus]